jgi:translation initiation factor IF-1
MRKSRIRVLAGDKVLAPYDLTRAASPADSDEVLR